MPTATDPYIEAIPGNLITAEDWNDVQTQIKDDIDSKIQTAVEGITTVKNAENADKLQNKTPEQLAQEIVEKALAELTKVTGYRNYFKRLKTGEEKVIEHKLNACPLVDVYQLDYFKAVSSEDQQAKELMWVNYYLYHSSEKTIRFGAAPNIDSIEIEPTEEPFFRIAFADMLYRYGVEYTDTSTLDDLETEFWDAFFKKPNDRFDDEQYCHSPWFDRCCGDRRSVRDLKSRGDWDEIWFKMKPRKTINHPTPPPTGKYPKPTPAPTQLQVVHFDFNTVGLTLLSDPVLDPDLTAGPGPNGPPALTGDALKELKVMVLLNAGAGIKIGTT